MTRGFRAIASRQQMFSAAAEMGPRSEPEQIGEVIEGRIGDTVDLTAYQFPGLTGMRVNKSSIYFLGAPQILGQDYRKSKLYHEKSRRVASSGGIRPCSTGAHVSYKPEHHQGVVIESKSTLNTGVSYTLTIEFIERDE